MSEYQFLAQEYILCLQAFSIVLIRRLRIIKPSICCSIIMVGSTILIEIFFIRKLEAFVPT